MDKVLDTLFYPYENGFLTDSQPASAAFLNARYHPALERFKEHHHFLYQPFKPYAQALQEHGFTVSSSLGESEKSNDLVFVLIPKNITEACFLVARALMMLKDGGILICAADNKAGGQRIEKMLHDFGLEDVNQESKNKARVAWGVKNNIDEETIKAALDKGAMQNILDGKFVSVPGIFGWDKIDKGSEILLQHLPGDLPGHGADFGCGYGYLSRHSLESCTGIESLCCIDADFRALQACQDNLGTSETPIRYFWEDLTTPLSGAQDFDWILMNPPFHEGKAADADIGIGFIQSAFESLRPGGKLWMVANAQLPYEDTLESLFKTCSKIYEGQGFKIFCAAK